MSPDENERLQILEMVAAGQITAAQAIELIKALDNSPAADPEAQAAAETPEPSHPPVDNFPPADEAQTALPAEEPPSPAAAAYPPQPQPSLRKWRNWWQIPLWIGVVITVMGAILMYLAWQAQQFSFLFVCSWLPFLIGVAVLALSWASRNARWLHVRIHQKPGERPEHIAFSFPIPTRLTAWGLRLFGRRISGLERANFDQMMRTLDTLSPDAPLYVAVDDDEDGESVEVYIG